MSQSFRVVLVVVRSVCDTSSLGFWLTVWDVGKVTGPQIAKRLEKIRFEGTEKLFSLIKATGVQLLSPPSHPSLFLS